MVDNEWGISQYPLVAGHEIIGKVAARGSNVQNLEEGMTVGLGWHSGYCGHCHSCKTGDQNLCQTAQGTIVAHHGGFADKVRAEAASVIEIPEGIDLASAGPLMALSYFDADVIIEDGLKRQDISYGYDGAYVGIHFFL